MQPTWPLFWIPVRIQWGWAHHRQRMGGPWWTQGFSFPCQKYQAVCLEHEVFTLYNAENSNHSFLQNDIWNCFFYNMTYRNLGLENARSMRIIETFQTMDINTISQEMECYGMMTLCHWCPALHLFKKTLKPGSYPQNLQNGSFDVIWICLHSSTTLWNRFSTVWFYKCALFRMITSF